MYASEYWVTSYFSKPVVATTTIVYLGSDGMHRNISAVERITGESLSVVERITGESLIDVRSMTDRQLIYAPTCCVA